MKMLKPNGKILTFLTLYSTKNPIMEWVKPKLRQITSIEFGPVLYKDTFLKEIGEYGFEVKNMEKVGKDVSQLMRLFNIYKMEIAETSASR